MVNKFVSILTAVGKAFKSGLDEILKFGQLVTPFVQVAEPIIGAILSTTIGIVLQTEQKFAALGKQSGTGSQKLAEVTAIVGPLLTVVLSDAGKPADATKVTDYINKVVNVLNATPSTAITLPSSSLITAGATPATS